MADIIIQPIIRTGWVLTKDGKFWGIDREGDGHTIDTYGWTDDLSKVQITAQLERPRTKTYFTHTNSPYIESMQQGDWVFVNLTTEHKLEQLMTPVKEGKKK